MKTLKQEVLAAIKSGSASREEWERIARAYPDQMTYRTSLADTLLAGEWLGGGTGEDIDVNWSLNPDTALSAACALIKAAKRIGVGRFSNERN